MTKRSRGPELSEALEIIGRHIHSRDCLEMLWGIAMDHDEEVLVREGAVIGIGNIMRSGTNLSEIAAFHLASVLRNEQDREGGSPGLVRAIQGELE